jgi:hypothetical protein
MRELKKSFCMKELKKIVPSVPRRRPKSLSGYPRRSFEKQVAQKTIQGGKY